MWGFHTSQACCKKEIKAGSTKGHAAPLEEEKAMSHTCMHMYFFIAVCVELEEGRASQQERLPVGLERHPDQML